mmetsp:Transcript_65149/g.141958  ORF Transcript_65149/g.141958 Transcript_65149/m.141958 type:complete len:241 (+) Transcript_65149:154-876(+)
MFSLSKGRRGLRSLDPLPGAPEAMPAMPREAATPSGLPATPTERLLRFSRAATSRKRKSSGWRHTSPVQRPTSRGFAMPRSTFQGRIVSAVDSKDPGLSNAEGKATVAVGDSNGDVGGDSILLSPDDRIGEEESSEIIQPMYPETLRGDVAPFGIRRSETTWSPNSEVRSKAVGSEGPVASGLGCEPGQQRRLTSLFSRRGSKLHACAVQSTFCSALFSEIKFSPERKPSRVLDFAQEQV